MSLLLILTLLTTTTTIPTTTSLTLSNTMGKRHNELFSKCLPLSRLGIPHPTLDSFEAALKKQSGSPSTSTSSVPMQSKTKEFTLIVVTGDPEDNNSTSTSKQEIKDKDKDKATTTTTMTSQTKTEKPNGRILLGMKNRGFGMGYYNSFGGKFDSPEETVEECACRELREETNIQISIDEMKHRKVGIQRYTFENNPSGGMMMHVFRIHLNDTNWRTENNIDIRGCEEITPHWFDDWYEIPFGNMFADDSIWLTTLLSSDVPLQINGWYHFKENCQETNTILHYYVDIKPKQQQERQEQQQFSLEQRLFHELHNNEIRSPTIKEFKECYAFMNTVRGFFSKQKETFDVVIDVAGGHGALAALFLACSTAYKAIVIDPADVGKQGVQRAWKTYITDKKTLLYRHECLRTGLPEELKHTLSMKSMTAKKVLVVAAHACQHLSEEILQISLRYGVHAAVMPCCQKDLSPGSSWKATSKNINVPIAKIMDILLAGKMMSIGTHDVRMKCIDAKITPQNRIILCRAMSVDEQAVYKTKTGLERAHNSLTVAYKRAHINTEADVAMTTTTITTKSSNVDNINNKNNNNMEKNVALHFDTHPIMYLAIGFAAGIFASLSMTRR